MPINIYDQESNDQIAWLCDEIWELPIQLAELEQWLKKNVKGLPVRNYVADIGFDIRKEATGGGGTLSAASMKLMADIGMQVFFSEYPNASSGDDEKSSNREKDS